MSKTYLGDGAYVEIDRDLHEVVLTAEDGIKATDRVVLGPHELATFLDLLQAAGIIRWSMPDLEDADSRARRFSE